MAMYVLQEGSFYADPCVEPLCCGRACTRAKQCAGAVFPYGASRSNAMAPGHACKAAPSTLDGGVLCCRDTAPPPAPPAPSAPLVDDACPCTTEWLTVANESAGTVAGDLAPLRRLPVPRNPAPTPYP